MQPYLEQVCAKLKNLGGFVHENVRYHVCLTLTQIAFGQLRFVLGRQDSDEKIEWASGLPVQVGLPDQVKQFLDTIVIPHFKERVSEEQHKEVIEKVLECVRDLCDEMGPASIVDHLEWIIVFVEQLLDKTATCQTRGADKSEGPAEDDDEQDSCDQDEEDLDHDELILGNATDLIISLSKCLGDSFVPYLARLGPKLYKYLGDDHPKSDKIMVLGCLSETFNQCPAAIQAYFNDFMQVLLKHSTSDDGSLNRNVSYGLAICADKAPVDMFTPHLSTTM